MTDSPREVALLVATALERAGIPYLVGGSVASTVHGEPRSTLDVDFATHLSLDRIDALIEELGPSFIADRVGLDYAVRNQASANLIHHPSMVKVDLFVRPREGLFAAEMERAVTVRLGATEAMIRVASPEDTILQKLRWYEKGARISDRQWRDILGVWKASGARLDVGYMERWARELGLLELFERSRAEGADS